MIFNTDDTDDEKLTKATDAFLRTLSAHQKRRKELQTAFAFRHGDQWDSAAKAQLEQEGRAALTFNLVSGIVRELIGANQDQRREAKAAPVGTEDAPTSETINHLADREYAAKDVNDCDDQVFEDMVVGGIGWSFIDVQPDYDDPSQMNLTIEPVSPFEVLYDIDARRTNLRDSKEFWWARWIGESDFKRDYPDFAGDFDRLSKEGSTLNLDMQSEMTYGGRSPRDIYGDPKWFDDKQRKVRIVRLMYEVPVTKYFAWDPRPDPTTGEPMGLQPVKQATYQAFKKSGVTETYKTTGCEWRWFEFTALQILFDDKQPLDLGGPQLRAATCYFDSAKGYHYGMMRDLIDPQSEFNKRYSQELNLVNKQLQPGVIADNGAFGDDPREAERNMRKAGFVQYKTPGKEFQVIPPPQLPTGTENLRQSNLAIIGQISGVDTNPMLGGQPDQVAVGTAMLSHRKGLLSISTILGNFRSYQKGQRSDVVRTILTTYPDAQIEAMLGNSEKLRVQQGMVIDVESGTSVPLRNLRNLKWNIEMDSAAANTTQQLLTLNMFQALQAGGTAIDPEVMFDSVPVSKDQRQKLVAYHKAQSQAAAQMQAQQQQTAQQQVDDVLKIEMSKVAQKAQADAQSNLTDQQKIKLDAFVKLLGAFLGFTGDSANRAIDMAEHQVNTVKTAADIQIDRRMMRHQESQPQPQAAA